MEFPKLKTPVKKKADIRDFSLGLNPRDTAPYNSLLYSENTVFTDEGITARGGIFRTGNMFFRANAARNNNLRLTDAALYINGKYNRLWMLYEALGSFSYRYSFKFLSDEGLVTDAGVIDLPLGSDGVVRMPVSVLCVSGKAARGCGVFVFLTLQTSQSEGYNFEVYELSNDFKSWIFIDNNELYIPTYYINGRGNYHYRSEEDLPEPKYNEALNLLGGTCNCFFTTDGVSDAFYLPIAANTELEDYMKVELSANLDTVLNFTFQKGSRVSNTVKYGEYEVYLSYNGGFLQLRSQTNNYIAQRIYGRNNNLKVTVRHETNEQLKMRALMSVCSWHNLSEEGSQLVLTGNSLYNELVLVSAPNNPLYFPEDFAVYCGKGNQKITAAVPLENSMLIFKENEIYALSVRSKKPIITKIFDGLGTQNGASVKSDMKSVIFLGSDNKIYAVTHNFAVREVSAPIDSYISPVTRSDRVFAIFFDNEYLLLCDNIAFNLNLKRSGSDFKTPVWNIWRFPEDMQLIDGFDNCGKKIFIGSAATVSEVNYYIADMSMRQKDVYYIKRSNGSAAQSVTANIGILIKTALYNPSEQYTKKTFTKAVLYMNSVGETRVSFINEKGDIIKTQGINITYEGKTLKPVRLYPLVHSLRCGIQIEGECDLTLRAMQLEYYEMSE